MLTIGLFFLTLILFPSALQFYYISLFILALFAFISLDDFPIKGYLIVIWALIGYAFLQVLFWEELIEPAGLVVFREAYLHVVSQFRIFSRFILPTAFGAFLGFSLPIVVREAEKSTHGKVLLPLMVVFIILTKSIGAVIIGAFSLAVYLYLSGRKKIFWILFSAALLILVAVVILRGHTLSQSPPWKLRLTHWKRTLQVYKESPLTGVGFRRFHLRALKYSEANEVFSLYTHNAFLQFLAEGGAFSLLVLITFILPLRLKEKPPPALMAAFAGWLLYNFIDIGFYFPSMALAGSFFASGILEIKGKRSFKGLVYFLVPLILLSFTERGFLSRLKWNYYTGKKETSLPVDPKKLFYYDDEGLYYLYRLDGKISHLRRALKIYPVNPSVHYLLGIEMLKRGNLSLALHHLKIASLQHPSNLLYKKLLRSVERQLSEESKEKR